MKTRASFSRNVAVTPATSIVQTAASITIDGTIDAGWANAVANTLSLVATNSPEPNPTPADASASWRALWDATNLYVLVEINDIPVAGR